VDVALLVEAEVEDEAAEDRLEDEENLSTNHLQRDC
jgi:hypothetical protein